MLVYAIPIVNDRLSLFAARTFVFFGAQCVASIVDCSVHRNLDAVAVIISPCPCCTCADNPTPHRMHARTSELDGRRTSDLARYTKI
jgi:hypothetical protein